MEEGKINNDNIKKAQELIKDKDSLAKMIDIMTNNTDEIAKVTDAIDSNANAKNRIQNIAYQPEVQANVKKMPRKELLKLTKQAKKVQSQSNNSNNADKVQIIHITRSRKTISIRINKDFPLNSICEKWKCIAILDEEDQVFMLYHNPEERYKNTRASNIAGTVIRGDAYIVCVDVESKEILSTSRDNFLIRFPVVNNKR